MIPEELIGIAGGEERAQYLEKTLKMLKEYWRSGYSPMIYKVRFDLAERFIKDRNIFGYPENMWGFSMEEEMFLSISHEYRKYEIDDVMKENGLVEIGDERVKISSHGIEILGLSDEESLYVYEALKLLTSELSYYNQLRGKAHNYLDELHLSVADAIVKRNSKNPFAPKENKSYHILRYSELKIGKLMKELNLVKEIIDDKKRPPARYLKITEKGRKKLSEIEEERRSSGKARD